MQRVKDANDLLNFLSVVLVSAPDKFRNFDFLADDEQMNLRKAFIELRCGLGFLSGVDKETLAQLSAALDRSLLAYESGDAIKGAHFLQEFEESAFPGV